MKDQQILHLSRQEKKMLIHGWNARSRGATEAGSPKPTNPSECAKLDPAAFHRQSDSPSRCAETPWTAVSSEPQQTQEQVEPLPLTVGLVRHSYRFRARKVEQVSALKASDAVRGTKEKLAGHRQTLEKQRPPRHVQSVEAATTSPEQAVVDADADQSEGNQECCISLDSNGANRVTSDTVYRDALLRRIRHGLASGRAVPLRVDCADASEVRSASLALQLLCSQSLLLCARDQDVSPVVGHGAVALELRPRASGSSDLKF